MGPQPAFPLVPSGKALRVVAGGRSFLKRQPLIAKALPTGVGFLFGDVLTQAAAWRGASQQQQQGHEQGAPEHHQQSFLQCYDPTRGVKMALVGALLAAPLLLGVLRGMDLVLAAPHSLGANALKFTVDQVRGGGALLSGPGGVAGGRRGVFAASRAQR